MGMPATVPTPTGTIEQLYEVSEQQTPRYLSRSKIQFE